MGKMMNATVVDGLKDPREDGRTCCLCSESDFRLLHSWEAEHPRNSSFIPLGFWECKCKLGVLHPVPDATELPDHADWWSPNRKITFRNPHFKHYRAKVLNGVFGTPVQRLIRQTRRARPGRRLLDIGCGRGQLLSEASRYYQCDGLEPSAQAAEQARQRGFQVIEDCFEPAQIPSATYDVVTLDSVLEHVLDPADVLRKVNRILKPSGVVAVKVPKLWGPSHHRHGREWNGYRVGYHLTMFSGKTMIAVLCAAGFTALSRPRRDRMLDDVLIVWGRKMREMQERNHGEPARHNAA